MHEGSTAPRKGQAPAGLHGYGGAVPASDSDLTLDHDQVKFRKMHLQAYFVKLVTQPFDSRMLLFLDWVGRIHTAQAGNPAIHVPMVQVNALFGFLHDALTVVLQRAKLPPARRDAMVRAFSRLTSSCGTTRRRTPNRAAGQSFQPVSFA